MPDPLQTYLRFMKSLAKFAVVALAVCHGSLHAQANTATASRKADLQIGGTFEYGNSDYTPEKSYGFGGYVTYDFMPHIGVELNIRQSNSTLQTYERTYQLGGRYVFRPGSGRYNPYLRVSFGRGVFNFPNSVANLAYNLASGAGGLDYQLLPKVTLRGEYEYQKWFSFPPNGLGPQMINVGAAYHF